MAERPVVFPVEVDTTASNTALARLEARARRLQARGARGAGIPLEDSEEVASSVMSGLGAPLVAATALHATQAQAGTRGGLRPDMAALEGRSATLLARASAARAAVVSTLNLAGAAERFGITPLRALLSKGITNAVRKEFPGFRVSVTDAKRAQGVIGLLIAQGATDSAAIKEATAYTQNRIKRKLVNTPTPPSILRRGTRLAAAATAAAIFSGDRVRHLDKRARDLLGRQATVDLRAGRSSLKQRVIERGGVGRFGTVAAAGARGILATGALRSALGTFIGASLIQLLGSGSPNRINTFAGGGIKAYAAGAAESVLSATEGVFVDTAKAGLQLAVEAKTLMASLLGDTGAGKSGRRFIQDLRTLWDQQKITSAKVAVGRPTQALAKTIAKAEGAAGRFDTIHQMDTDLYKILINRAFDEIDKAQQRGDPDLSNVGSKIQGLVGR